MRGDRVFLVRHRNGGHWGFPKGRKEAGETDLEAAKRELSEETGLDLVKILCENPLIENRSDGKVVTYFLAEVGAETTLQEAEVLDGKWVTLSELEGCITFEEGKKLAQEVIRRLA